MSSQFTKKFPVANAVVARIRSELFENSAIVAHLLDEGEATEETINEIVDRLRQISSSEAALKSYTEHFVNASPPSIKSPPRHNPNKKVPSADIHAGMPRPAGPDELMAKLESKADQNITKKKPCKDCNKPRKRT